MCSEEKSLCEGEGYLKLAKNAKLSEVLLHNAEL